MTFCSVCGMPTSSPTTFFCSRCAMDMFPTEQTYNETAYDHSLDKYIDANATAYAKYLIEHTPRNSDGNLLEENVLRWSASE